MGVSMQHMRSVVRPIGGKNVFYWEEIVDIQVSDHNINPFKKSKYQKLVKAVDHIASTYKGCDLFLAIYEHKGVLTIVEGQPTPDNFAGALMDSSTNNTSHYDHYSHTLSIHLEEVDKMQFTHPDTGERMQTSLEYVLYYLLLYAAEPMGSSVTKDLATLEQHLPH